MRSTGTAPRRREIITSNVIVVIGPGSIGQAIARRVSAGKRVLLADLRKENAAAAAEVLISTATVDVSSRESVHALVEAATALGDVTGVTHAAGVSPSQAKPATILAVDLYGTALVLEEFGNVIARGGAVETGPWKRGPLRTGWHLEQRSGEHPARDPVPLWDRA
jgi:NAD(P)-dependent dehydrogenase (short-subunit alcohol dehydrogenase family)